jgi:hypothetical protein
MVMLTVTNEDDKMIEYHMFKPMTMGARLGLIVPLWLLHLL